MSQREQKAMECFMRGNNCCQAVVAAFADEWDMSLEDVMRMSSMFGGGFAQMREVCGAVSGMFMAMGMHCGHTSPEQADLRKENYRRLQGMAEQFRADNGSMLCGELLEKAPDPQNPRPYCAELVKYAVGMTADEMEKDKVTAG